ncbi:MAG: hypothetical protein Q4C96_09300 [Planctomycetia bacterium]|nr:hypothetical protein [Planctomycetia bacterium]
MEKWIFRGWPYHTWHIKIHTMIFVTAIILMMFSCWGYFFYNSEINKLSDRFMRLQVIGPRMLLSLQDEIPNSGVETESRKRREPFKCRFHVETRSPAGNALPETKIEFLLKNPDGTPFFSLHEKTDAHGCLNLELPNFEKLPPYVFFQVIATHGKKEESCEGRLEVVSREISFFNNSAEEVSIMEIFEKDVCHSELSSSYPENTAVGFLSEIHGISPLFFMEEVKISHVGSVKMEIPSEKIILPAGEPLSVYLHAEKPGVPVILCLWCRDFLVGYRPKITGKVSRKVEIPIPNNFSGLMAVTLYDYQETSPKMLQQAFIVRMPEDTEKGKENRKTLAEKAEIVNHDLENIIKKINGKKSQFKKIRGGTLEYMSQDLPIMDNRIKNFPLIKEEISEEKKLQEQISSPYLYAISELFGATLDGRDTEISCSENEIIFETFPPKSLRMLEAVIMQILLLPEGEERETRKLLIRNVLKFQEEIYRKELMRRNTGISQAESSLLRHAPVVYDGMLSLESLYRQELRNFQKRIHHGLGNVICLIFCLICGLVILVVMLTVLKIPTGRNVWMATLAVTCGAFLMAVMIFSKSDFKSDARNVIFHTWLPGVSVENSGQGVSEGIFESEK